MTPEAVCHAGRPNQVVNPGSRFESLENNSTDVLSVAVGGKIRREARTAFVQACSLRVAGTSAAGLGSDE